MISVTLKTSTIRKTVSVNEDTTPRQVFENNGLDIDPRSQSLNGQVLSEEDLDTSLEDLGVTDSCFLSKVVKADGACA